MKQSIILIVVFILIVGGASFFAGTAYQSGKAPSRQFGLDRAGGAPGPNGGRAGTRSGTSRGAAGEIISADDKSITVKLIDGSSKIVFLSEKTIINKASAGTRDDLTVGTKIAAFGTDNSDGSVTATNVQINPVFGGDRMTPNKATKSPDAKEYVITGSDYAFSPKKLTVKTGEKVRIVLKNTEGSHDFVIDELNMRTAITRSGEEDFVEFTPDKPGTYEFYCSVANHRMIGMTGTLTVE